MGCWLKHNQLTHHVFLGAFTQQACEGRSEIVDFRRMNRQMNDAAIARRRVHLPVGKIGISRHQNTVLGLRQPNHRAVGHPARDAFHLMAEALEDADEPHVHILIKQ